MIKKFIRKILGVKDERDPTQPVRLGAEEHGIDLKLLSPNAGPSDARLEAQRGLAASEGVEPEALAPVVPNAATIAAKGARA